MCAAHTLTRHAHTVRVGLDSTYSRRPVMHEASEQVDTRLSELLYYLYTTSQRT